MLIPPVIRVVLAIESVPVLVVERPTLNPYPTIPVPGVNPAPLDVERLNVLFERTLI